MKVDPDLLDRLADPADPALRAKVLADLQGRPEDDPELKEATTRIAEQPWIRATLAAQKPDGTWGEGPATGYTGTLWALYHLSEMGAPGHLPEIRKGVEWVQTEAKAVAKIRGRRADFFAGRTDGVFWGFPTACFTGHTATALIRFGHLTHPVTRSALSSCRALFDAEEGFRCFVMDDSLLPACFMSVPAVLKAFLAIPHLDRRREDRLLIDAMVALLKKRRLYRYVAQDAGAWREWGDRVTAQERREAGPKWYAEGRADPRREKVGWLRFGFPHSYNSDLLDVVLLLGEARTGFDGVVEEGLELILSKRGEDGMWTMATGLNGKMHADLNKRGAPSPWITYRALLAFRRFGLLEV